MSVDPTLSTWLAAGSAVASAIFAAISWRSWRSQFYLSLPFVEVEYERLSNAHLIHWTKDGERAAEWSTEAVSVKGGTSKLARYRSMMRLSSGRASVGAVYDVGSTLNDPRSDFVIVEQLQPTKIVLTFKLRSKAHPRLTKKVRHTVELPALDMPNGPATSGLFSGDIELSLS